MNQGIRKGDFLVVINELVFGIPLLDLMMAFPFPIKKQKQINKYISNTYIVDSDKKGIPFLISVIIRMLPGGFKIIKIPTQ